MMSTSLKDKIIKDKLPAHIAIIMDGNGRWAKRRGNDRIFGHQHAVKAVRETTEAAAELGIRYLTLYTFSKENWNRPKKEIDALMSLLVKTLQEETQTLIKNNIRLRVMGELETLPDKVIRNIKKSVEITSGNTGLTLVLALSYSGRWEILEAVRNIAKQIKKGNVKPDDVTDEFFSSYLITHNIPDPELLIRTSGEYRISNFLLWQIAYSELYFTETLWPDFTKEDLYKAICSFQNRERRFGKISEQVIS
jgi:undecaprenyl diphosphate synthase